MAKYGRCLSTGRNVVSQVYFGDSARVKEWMSQRLQHPLANEAHTTIALVEGERIRGAVWLEGYNGVSISIHVAGEGRHWATKKYLTSVFHYVFDVLKCKKLLGTVLESNLAARRFDEGLGFKIEAFIKDVAPDGGLIIYSMTREQCKFLES